VAAASGWPGHAVLLVGPEDVGRDDLAEAMAIAWARLVPPFTDLWRRAAPLPIDDVRSLARRVAERPLAGERHAVLVTGSERLSPLVQNAFLRLVEEPPGPAAFLFTAANPHALLPTLRSRFTPVPLRPLDRGRFVAVLVDEAGWSPEDAQQAYAAAGGWPARALAQASAEAARLPVAAGPFGFVAVAREHEVDPDGFLRAVASALRQRLWRAEGDPRRLRRGLLAVDEARRRLERHLQPALVLENLLLDLEEHGLIPGGRDGTPPSTAAGGGRGATDRPRPPVG
jgi:hypothetical protein